jgi:hypothetical protein
MSKSQLAKLELERACELEGGGLVEMRLETRACIIIMGRGRQMSWRNAHGTDMAKQIVDDLEIPKLCQRFSSWHL